MIKASTGLRNQMLDTASFQDIFTAAAGTEIRIFSGAAPATADAAETGTKLCTIKEGSNGLAFGAAADGAINKAAGTWSGVISNAGALNAGYFRLVLGADDGQASTSAPRVQGEVGTLTSPKDLNLASLALENGATQPVDIFTISFPTA